MVNPYNNVKLHDTALIETVIERATDLVSKPTVLIRCITYNHGEYIRDALESFISQRTDFYFVALVHDDASTDDTAQIIMEYAHNYPDIIIPVCDTINRYSERTLVYVMDRMIDAFQPKYVAICEGDDYWIDSLKLQKQVEYMETHPECVMCHGDYELTNGNKRKTLPHYDNEAYFGPGHIHSYSIASLTTLYSYEAYRRIPNWRMKYGWPIGDYPLWIELSQEGLFHYMPETLGKYRVLPNSASHSTNCENIKKFWKCENEIVEHYSKLYGYEYKRPTKIELYNRIQNQCFNNKDKVQAKKYWKEAHNCNACSLKSFLYFFCNIYNLRWLINIAFHFLK